MGVVAVVIVRIVTMVVVGQMVSVLVMVAMVMTKMRVELWHFRSEWRLSDWEGHQPTHSRMRGHVMGVHNVCEMVVR
jgi:hypothetical protein